MATPDDTKPDPRAAAKRFLVGHVQKSAWESLQEAADWCREHGAKGDTYGDGPVLNDFEAEVAALLGMEAAVFMPSGTMAQQIAARIWCDRAGTPALGMHPTCHMELHEQRGYAWLHGLRGVMVGAPYEAVTAAHLTACHERLGVLVVELPMREIGGVLPSWEQLQELKTAAQARGVALHMDGARLWEAAPHFGKSYQDIAAGFDSAYVSFYKGIGGLTGAMLLGRRDFIAEAKVWLRRHGGNLYRLLPYVASARANFGKRLAQMPARIPRINLCLEKYDVTIFFVDKMVRIVSRLTNYLAR